jgi:riboflavin-specific deaminase-like protein
VADGADTTKKFPAPRPAVTLSYAQTLDGRLATSTGNSQWISAPESLRFGHELRAKHDAIMVGVGTVRKDDPRLTVRRAIEYPVTPPMSIESEERVGCVTV